jgi:hypothetical protein
MDSFLSGWGEVRKRLIPNLKFNVRDRRDACPTPIAAWMQQFDRMVSA